MVLIAGATLAMTPGLAATAVRARKVSRAPSWAVVNIDKPLSWAAVNIAKPTYTPQPSPTPAPTTAFTPDAATSLPDASPTLSSDLLVTQDLPGFTSGDATQVDPGGKYILVSISQQHLFAYQGGQLLYSFVASTGMGNSTRAGTFNILDKIPNAYGATWGIWMPDWLGIYWSGSLENGIHALPILPSGDRLWSGYLGTPISFGCVVLGIDDALELYNWAEVGTPVEIRW